MKLGIREKLFGSFSLVLILVVAMAETAEALRLLMARFTLEEQGRTIERGLSHQPPPLRRAA